MLTRTSVCLLLGAAMAAGCAPSRLAVRPVRYAVEVRVDPVEHLLSAEASVELEQLEPERARRRAAVELRLHPDLAVESLDVQGATVRKHKTRRGRSTDESGIEPVTHRLIVQDAADTIRVTLGYKGRLYQDVEAGEEQGQVHNFAMAAHVATEGLFLDEDGYWYPRLAESEDVDHALTLADFELAVEPVPGFELVAGLEREAPSDDGRLHWSSPFPLHGLVLLGGPLERHSRRHGDIELHAVLARGKQSVAEDILAASAEYLDHYQKLVGPYPYGEFTVLEAFFSSGFAFPTCTQIVGSQLSEHKQYRRHGYLDHELLHNWWGNGLLVDPDDGNWCEGLASYAGNYYGYVLEGDEQGARKQRRDHSNFLSDIEPEHDLPLGSFGQDDGAGRSIGYFKAAAVWHMLERKIGGEALFAGLRRLTAERMGKFTTWSHLQQAIEAESGQELDAFFEQWVRRGGAPLLELEAAEWRPGSDHVTVTIAQGPTDFTLDVPLRLYYGDRAEDAIVTIERSVDTVQVPCESRGLTAIELDPDYHLFRKLKPEETMPTSMLTRRGPDLLVVVPQGQLAEGYQVVVDGWTHEVLEDEKSHKVTVRTANAVTIDELASADVLIVGEAARHATVQRFLERTRNPVRWSQSSFSVEDEEYSGPRQAVLLTVHHPDRPDDGVTVYYGNSPAALANARVLTYYANSLLVYDTPEGDATTSSGMPHTEVVRRMDFEFHDRIEF